MIKLYNFDELKPEEILNRDIRAEKNVEDVVDAIIADVRTRGDDALKDYALKFDGATIENLQVTQAEIDEAFAGMDPAGGGEHRAVPPPAGAQEFCDERPPRHRTGAEIHPH